MLDTVKASDMILFDATKAREIVKQYNQFHLNFDDINYYQEVQNEREKYLTLFQKPMDSLLAQKNRKSFPQEWIKNYFFPLDITRIFKSSPYKLHLTKEPRGPLADLEILESAKLSRLEIKNEIQKKMQKASTTDNTRDGISQIKNSLSNQENLLIRDSNAKKSQNDSSNHRSSSNLNFYRIHSSDLEEDEKESNASQSVNLNTLTNFTFKHSMAKSVEKSFNKSSSKGFKGEFTPDQYDSDNALDNLDRHFDIQNEGAFSKENLFSVKVQKSQLSGFKREKDEFKEFNGDTFKNNEINDVTIKVYKSQETVSESEEDLENQGSIPRFYLNPTVVRPPVEAEPYINMNPFIERMKDRRSERESTKEKKISARSSEYKYDTISLAKSETLIDSELVKNLSEVTIKIDQHVHLSNNSLPDNDSTSDYELEKCGNLVESQFHFDSGDQDRMDLEEGEFLVQSLVKLSQKSPEKTKQEEIPANLEIQNNISFLQKKGLAGPTSRVVLNIWRKYSKGNKWSTLVNVKNRGIDLEAVEEKGQEDASKTKIKVIIPEKELYRLMEEEETHEKDCNQNSNQIIQKWIRLCKLLRIHNK